mmetsp:Transcript_33348/g.32413  ORF Transcript_33348/g.32413 Transcript_33348/m.32413 type:complete len:170 (+) Transcript_33348:230-739(+)
MYHLVRKDLVFCPACLKEIAVIVEYILDLGTKMYFFAKNSKEIFREVGIYNKISDHLHYLNHLEVPKHFLEWLSTVKKEVIIKNTECEICKKPLKARVDNEVKSEEGVSYACRFPCKMTLQSRIKKDNKNKRNRERIMGMKKELESQRGNGDLDYNDQDEENNEVDPYL